ncbi:MAG: patatin-like phospholipase family protein [Bacteroidales bacterium]
MRKTLTLFLLVMLVAFVPLYAADQQKDRPKIGLVLCGGGAKGAAHIGVLKILEKANVPIDIIVGTSMGALVGGMYSMGYDANQLDSIVSHCDWSFLLSDNTARRDVSFAGKMMDERYLISIPFYLSRPQKGKTKDDSDDSPISLLPGGFISGQNVLNLISGLAIGYQDSIRFSKLPIPFACVATNLSTGTEVVLKEGYLPLSLRASMAIPGVFAPVKMNGNVLVDGGMVNNFPVDVAKQLGADIIIGVDVQNDLAKPDQLNSISQVLMQIMGLMGNERYLENVKRTDIYIKPDVSNFSTFSFSKSAIDSLIINGYNAANDQYADLVALADKYNTDNSLRQLRAPRATQILKDTFRLADIIMKGVSVRDGEWLLKLSGLKGRAVVSGGDINRAISIFMGTKAFSSVDYMLEKLPTTGLENLYITFHKGPTNVFGVGARYDTEEAAAILLHLGIRENALQGSKFGLTGRLSYNPYCKVNYAYVSEYFPRVDLSYTFKSSDMNIYQNDDSQNYLKFYQNSIEVTLANRYLRNFDFKLGAKFDAFNYDMLLSSESEQTAIKFESQSYISAFLSAVMDDRDSKYFPIKGTYFNATAYYYASGFSSSFSPFAAMQLNLSGAASPSSRFTFLPALYTRVLIGRNPASPFLNFLGGTEPGRYVTQQLPFIGINYANIFDNSVAVLRLDLRQRIGNKHYVYALSNYARTAHQFTDMFGKKGLGYWGFGLKYAYSTALGPLSVDVHWSDYSKKVGVYLNMGYYF